MAHRVLFNRRLRVETCVSGMDATNSTWSQRHNHLEPTGFMANSTLVGVLREGPWAVNPGGVSVEA